MPKTEHPILFSGDMVRAILDGRKTQTRRVVNWKAIARQSGCTKGTLAWSDMTQSWAVFDGNGPADLAIITCPYGVPGDILVVRESWRAAIGSRYGDDLGIGIEYAASPIHIEHKVLHDYSLRSKDIVQALHYLDKHKDGSFSPSIHLPRWACRLLLRVKEVRVQRVQEISEADAIAEGMALSELDQTYRDAGVEACVDYEDGLVRFAELWDSLNLKRGFGWDTNCWAWAITFERIK